jgi:hypothetical protein
MPGSQNTVADALSRPAAVVAPAPVSMDFRKLASKQSMCSDVQALKDSESLLVCAASVEGAEMCGVIFPPKQ